MRHAANGRRVRVLAGLILALVALLGAAVGAPAQAAPGPKEGKWKLVWRDDFRRFDESKWYKQDGASNINGELEYYAPDDVYVEGGNLVLRSQQRELGGRSYTSGEVLTRDKFTTLYGRVQVRMKLPRGKGIWPAAWMLKPECDGLNGCPFWPPEIDILEHVGEQTTVYQTLHTGKYYHARWPDNVSQTFASSVSDVSEHWHVYEVVWDPNYIQFYIDGVPTGRIESSEQLIPDEPLGLILNTAVGGYWPGYPDETTVFPQYTYIDYVKVYQWVQN